MDGKKSPLIQRDGSLLVEEASIPSNRRGGELFDECEGNWNETEVLNSGKLEVEFSSGYGFALSGFPDPRWRNGKIFSLDPSSEEILLPFEGRREREKGGEK